MQKNILILLALLYFVASGPIFADDTLTKPILGVKVGYKAWLDADLEKITGSDFADNYLFAAEAKWNFGNGYLAGIEVQHLGSDFRGNYISNEGKGNGTPFQLDLSQNAVHINIFHTSYGAQREGYAGDGYYYGAGISFLFSELNGETGEITSEGEDNRDPVADDDTAIGFNAVLGFERDDMFIELQYVYAKSEDMEIGDLVINQELNFGGLYLWAGIRF